MAIGEQKVKEEPLGEEAAESVQPVQPESSTTIPEPKDPDDMTASMLKGLSGPLQIKTESELSDTDIPDESILNQMLTRSCKRKVQDNQGNEGPQKKIAKGPKPWQPKSLQIEKEGKPGVLKKIKYLYYCEECGTEPQASRNAVIAHYNKFHLKKPLACGMCAFTTYSNESLAKHYQRDHSILYVDKK